MPDNVTTITVEVTPDGGQKTTIVAGNQTQEFETGGAAAGAAAANVNPAGGQKTKVVINVTTEP
jgi:hypothetical protein